MDALGRNIEGAQLVVEELNQAVNSETGKSLLKASSAAINNYPEYSEGLRNFGSEIVARVATAPAPTLKQDEFDIQEASPEDYMSGTFLASSENLFNQNQEEQLDKTFVIGGEVGAPTLVQVPKEVVEPNSELRSQLDNLSFEGLNQVSNGAKVEEVQEQEKEQEQVTKVEEKAKQLVLKKGDKAAYIDTVILCLIAQLSIFGLLIIVLLIIK